MPFPATAPISARTAKEVPPSPFEKYAWCAGSPAPDRRQDERRLPRLARHHDHRRAQGRQGGDRGRRPGEPRPDRDQGHRAQGAQALPGSYEVIAGFAGSTADAFTLLERLEKKLEATPGQLARASVELAKDWRTDKYLQKLEAMLIVSDGKDLLVITGAGDVLEPEHDVTAIGSGGNFALAAGRALMDTDMDAEAIARRAMAIASDICVYTNGKLTVETLEA